MNGDCLLCLGRMSIGLICPCTRAAWDGHSGLGMMVIVTEVVVFTLTGPVARANSLEPSGDFRERVDVPRGERTGKFWGKRRKKKKNTKDFVATGGMKCGNKSPEQILKFSAFQ